MNLPTELGVVAASIAGWEIGKAAMNLLVTRTARPDPEQCRARGCAGRSTCRDSIGYGMLCGDDEICAAARNEFHTEFGGQP